MSRRQFTSEQIIRALRQAEVAPVGDESLEELWITAIHPLLWVLPKCFDTLSICGFCRPAPAPSLAFFGSRCPHARGGEVSTVIAPRA